MLKGKNSFGRSIITNCFGFLTWQLCFTALEVKEGEAQASKQ